jgi:hypothetical protein
MHVINIKKHLTHAGDIKLEGVVERALVSITGMMPGRTHMRHLYREQTWKGCLGHNESQVKVEHAIADGSGAIFTKQESWVILLGQVPIVMKMVHEHIFSSEILLEG